MLLDEKPDVATFSGLAYRCAKEPVRACSAVSGADILRYGSCVVDAVEMCEVRRIAYRKPACFRPSAAQFDELLSQQDDSYPASAGSTQSITRSESFSSSKRFPF
jgi:hypothetical protein